VGEPKGDGGKTRETERGNSSHWSSVKMHWFPPQRSSTYSSNDPENTKAMGVRCFCHPLYDPDLSLFDFHLCALVKEHLGGKTFKSNAVWEWVLTSTKKKFFETGI
jgi:hypothetical protein